MNLNHLPVIFVILLIPSLLILAAWTESSQYQIITFTTNEAHQIIPIIDGKLSLDCPTNYQITQTGIFENKIGYRCLLVQHESDCLDSEYYLRGVMTCISKNYDPDCGDRYFLDSSCHKLKETT